MISHDDPYIHKIAIGTIAPVDELLPSETKIDPLAIINPGYMYIGQRDNEMFTFSSNLSEITAAELILQGQLDGLYACDMFKRFPEKEEELKDPEPIQIDREAKRKKNKKKHKRRLKR